MPELPEVETIRRGMAAAIEGKVIHSVRVNRYDLRMPVPQDLGQSLTGRKIKALKRRGKYIIMDLDGDVTGVLHLGMSGRIHIYESERDYVANKHDHIVAVMDDGGCFAFEDPRRFGMFYLSDGAWQQEKPFSDMGPEPFREWTGEMFYDAIKNKSASIKSVLLDQRCVAGLGNIYVCEALYLAGVHPETRAGKVNRKEADKIVLATKEVLERAIEAGGSSLKDYRHTDGSLGYFQYGFSVYDRKGEMCRKQSCDGTVERVVQSNRSSFYCPVCQVRK